MQAHSQPFPYSSNAMASAPPPRFAAAGSSRSGSPDAAAARRRARGDLRYRVAYTKPELSQVLPFGATTLDEMIKRGLFPDGMRPHPTAHRIWPRRVVEEWLEKMTAQGGPR